MNAIDIWIGNQCLCTLSDISNNFLIPVTCRQVIPAVSCTLIKQTTPTKIILKRVHMAGKFCTLINRINHAHYSNIEKVNMADKNDNNLFLLIFCFVFYRDIMRRSYV